MKKNKLAIFFTILPLFFMLSSLFSCKPSLDCFRYIPQNNQKNIFQMKWAEDEKDQFLNFVCHPQNKDIDKPLFFQFEYKGQRKDLGKLKGVRVKMFEMQNGILGKEIPFAKTFVFFENADRYYLNIPMGKENYTGDWREVFYKRGDYPDESIHYFYFYLGWEQHFNFKNLPNQVKLDITVESTEGKKEFSLLLQKTEMECGKKVRTNPFG